MTIDRTEMVDLEAEQFPMLIEFFTVDGTVVHTIEVSGPGALQIPGLAATYGPVGCRTTFGNGEVVVTPPPGAFT